jgi:hypothetical protein
MRPAHRVAVGIVLACALGFVARRAAAPHALVSPAAPPSASIPARAPGRSVESAAPLPSAPPLSSLNESVDRGILLARHCLALAERDPLAAIDMALAHNLCADDPGLLGSLLLHWARQDFSAAHEWTRRQESGDWRDDMLARLAHHRSQSDPVAAAEIAATEIVATRARAEAILSVVHQWAEQGPEAALAWSARLADADLRRRVLDDIAAVQGQAAAMLTGPIGRE